MSLAKKINNLLAFSRKEKTMIAHFAPDFIPEFYKSRYLDLKNMDDMELKHHYDTFGIAEGRIASPMAERASFTSAFKHAKLSLEIGPFNHPLLSGNNARFFDVLDHGQLKARATSIGQSSDRIPNIDYVSPTGDLSIVDEKFDLIVSSHCIEHQPDLVRHLNLIEQILMPGGVYAILVPNCLFCFDHFLPPSNVGQVLEAFYNNRKVHTLEKIVEHWALTTHNDALRHWASDHGSDELNVARARDAVEAWKSSDGGYIDVHAWQFTPKSFGNMINSLSDLGLISLKPARIYNTPRNSHEFAAVLTR